ncbi:MAG: FG-GAP repeat protein [Candidatus Cloacimonetes bacterium]|nr:FG-GAP repeat protein [Candidatus Cloacimonadota bacterium]
MKNKKIIIVIFFLLSLVLLYAQNTMNQLAYLEGEQPRSWFGNTLAALDFNGDGYDDLVVSSPAINYTGRLYFYLGAEEFDDQVDFTLSGVLSNYLASYLTNIGDINGDGCEDLGYSCIDFDSLYINILLGNTEQDTIPSFVISRYELDYRGFTIRPLGDINNDGYDDVGITWAPSDFHNELLEYYILWGDNDITEPQYFCECGHNIAGFSGVGDVNNDGFDDFCLGYGYSIYTGTNKLCFGGETVDTLNSVVLWDDEVMNMTLGLAAGDLNNDGFADFGGHFYSDVDIWLGNENITSNYDITLMYGTGGGIQDFGFDYGDLNNDGFSDMVLGSPNWGLNGAAFLYLGNETPNNTVDIEFEEPPGVHHQFGRAVAIGSFDGDEYEDLAIAGPGETSTGPNPGYVYVLAGNGDLEDLVDVEENEIPSIKEITFNVYPNPFNPIINFEIKLTTSLRQGYAGQAEFTESMEIQIYNVKGQKVKTVPIVLSSPSHQVSITWNAEKQPSGVYFCKLINVEDSKVLSIKKVTLLK